MTALLPRESGEYIVKNAKFVKVSEAGIENLTQEIIKGILDKVIDVNNFSQHDLHPKATDEHAIEWIFVVDTLNFCFWTPSKLTQMCKVHKTPHMCAVYPFQILDGVPRIITLFTGHFPQSVFNFKDRLFEHLFVVPPTNYQNYTKYNNNNIFTSHHITVISI